MRDTPANRDIPTSDELIRRAKKDFAPTVYSRTYRVVSRAEDIEAMVEETMDTEAMAKAMADVMDDTMDDAGMMDSTAAIDAMMSRRARQSAPAPSVEHAPRVEHLSVPPAPFPSGSGSDTTSGGSAVLRAIGFVILLALAGLWVLLIIGAAQSPDEAGSILGGGVVLTVIPLIFALLVLRAARKPKQSQGIIS